MHMHNLIEKHEKFSYKINPKLSMCALTNLVQHYSESSRSIIKQEKKKDNQFRNKNKANFPVSIIFLHAKPCDILGKHIRITS